MRGDGPAANQSLHGPWTTLFIHATGVLVGLLAAFASANLFDGMVCHQPASYETAEHAGFGFAIAMMIVGLVSRVRTARRWCRLDLEGQVDVPDACKTVGIFDGIGTAVFATLLLSGDSIVPWGVIIAFPAIILLIVSVTLFEFRNATLVSKQHQISYIAITTINLFGAVLCLFTVSAMCGL